MSLSRRRAGQLPPEVQVAIAAALAGYLAKPPAEYRLMITGPEPRLPTDIPEWNRAGRWQNVNRWQAR